MSQLAPQPEHDFYMQHGHYGWVAEKEDWARIDYMKLKVMMALPEVDIEALPDSAGIAKWIQIENQGSVGSCAGHARTSCQEVAYYRQTKGKVVQLNRMYAYISAQEFDGIRGDRGSTVSGNCEVAHTKGTPREELWPYPGHYTGIPSNLRGQLDEDALNYRINSWKDLKDYEEVLQWLVHGIGGVNIGIGWTLNPGSDGRVDRYRSGGGGHSIMLGDWDKRFKDSRGRPYIVLFNSWGRNWGDNGVAYIHPDVVTQWCQGQTVIGMSDMMNITPREFDWDTEPNFV